MGDNIDELFPETQTASPAAPSQTAKGDDIDSLFPETKAAPVPANTTASTATDALQGFGHMLGLGPHINAGVDWVGSHLSYGGKPLVPGGEDYSRNLEIYRNADKAAQSNSPIAYGAGQIVQTAPVMAATGGSIPALAAVGATSGALESDHLKDVPLNAAGGAAANAVVGGALKGAGVGLQALAQTTGGKYLTTQISSIIKEQAPGWEDKLAQIVAPVKEYLSKQGIDPSKLGTDTQIAKTFAEMSSGEKYGTGIAPQVAQAAGSAVLAPALKSAVGAIGGEVSGGAIDYGYKTVKHATGIGPAPSIMDSLTSNLAAAGALYGGRSLVAPVIGAAANKYATTQVPQAIKSVVAGNVGNSVGNFANEKSQGNQQDSIDQLFPELGKREPGSRLQNLIDEWRSNP